MALNLEVCCPGTELFFITSDYLWTLTPSLCVILLAVFLQCAEGVCKQYACLYVTFTSARRLPVV